MSSVLAHSVQFTGRRLRAFARQPGYLMMTLVQPVIWLLLFGQLFKGVAALPGFPASSYVAFLTPGIVVMTALNSNSWSGMSYVLEMERGLLDRFLVSPVRRLAMILGDLGYMAITTIIQSLIVIGLGLLAGAHLPGGLSAILAFLVATTLLGSAFAAYSNAIALLVRRQESVIGIVNFLVLPLTFLSSTLMPAALMPKWIENFARFNPVTWAVTVGRQMLEAQVDWGLVTSRLGYLLALAVVLVGLSTLAFRSYQRSA